MPKHVYDYVGDTPTVIRGRLVSPGDVGIEFDEEVVHGNFVEAGAKKKPVQPAAPAQEA